MTMNNLLLRTACLLGLSITGLHAQSREHGATNPWNGSWTLDAARSSPSAAGEGAPHQYRFALTRRSSGALSIRWEIPELGEVVTGFANGVPMRIASRESSPGMTLSVTAEGEAVLVYEVRRGHQLFGSGRMMLVDGGRAWVDLTWPAKRQDLASVLTYVKAADSAAHTAPLQPANQLSSAEVAPASLKHPLVPSHGSNLLGALYLASGSQPHPTAILFHGFPGYEQNLDLAQALRSAGWNVLAMHYRGSWGVQGSFSFTHCLEDADAELAFLLNPANAATYRVDTSHIVVIGHSMGGFVAAAVAAHHPEIRAAVLISAWNIGAARSDEADEAKALAAGENLAPISGADGATLAHEEFTHRAELDMQNLAPALAARPVMLLTANDHSDQFASPFAAALTAAGEKQLQVTHFDTDHAYSEKRKELTDAVLAFLKTQF